ncbi:SUKH-4 family immunity protein [Tenacibaculum ovolyticum]|uniref:SUKH-4 family immunity protein n=1 Tax=Tenacibaculum ovolyticum TaxID=104270 RepID=UPI000491C5F3|nr:SUKH-4 family immunity protein [Tenacibaculum ovolyticum]
MSPIEFKEIWMRDDSEKWIEFPSEQVEKSNLNNETKGFLKVGLPEDSAPFLSFGLRSYDWEFNTIQGYYDDYDLNEKAKNYWIFGSDGSGNPICIDSSDNDKLILLDHEQDFEIIQTMNKNISELASSMLLFRNFIEKVNSELGKDGFFDSKFTENHLVELENGFKKLNPDYYIQSSFWDSEIENLRAEIE